MVRCLVKHRDFFFRGTLLQLCVHRIRKINIVSLLTLWKEICCLLWTRDIDCVKHGIQHLDNTAFCWKSNELFCSYLCGSLSKYGFVSVAVICLLRASIQYTWTSYSIIPRIVIVRSCSSGWCDALTQLSRAWLVFWRHHIRMSTWTMNFQSSSWFYSVVTSNCEDIVRSTHSTLSNSETEVDVFWVVASCSVAVGSNPCSWYSN
jgi:hypothetical protein